MSLAVVTRCGSIQLGIALLRVCGPELVNLRRDYTSGEPPGALTAQLRCDVPGDLACAFDVGRIKRNRGNARVPAAAIALGNTRQVLFDGSRIPRVGADGHL